jgi:DNA-binding winged helix-turn-helix (wHTH) protein
MLNTDNLTTPITGQFRNPLRDITAQELFRNIQKAHFNINTNIEERNDQRQKLAEWRTQEDQPAKIEDQKNEKND